MIRTVLFPVLAAALLGGCVTGYDYRPGAGDYYYGQPSVQYNDAGYGYGGYGYPGGWSGQISLGYGSGGYGYGGYPYGYGGYGYGYPYGYGGYGYGYPYGGYGYPIIVLRPDTGRVRYHDDRGHHDDDDAGAGGGVPLLPGPRGRIQPPPPSSGSAAFGRPLPPMDGGRGRMGQSPGVRPPMPMREPVPASFDRPDRQRQRDSSGDLRMAPPDALVPSRRHRP